MRRVIIIAAFCAGAAGCSSMDLPSLDALKPAPPTAKLRLESEPSGAQATTSAGPACTTPCEVDVATDKDLSVTFTLDKHLPQTVTVARVDLPGESIDGFDGIAKPGFDPNPVVATLEPAPPPKRGRARRQAAPKPQPQPARRAAPAAQQQQQSSPFPPPPGARQDSVFPPPPSR